MTTEVPLFPTQRRYLEFQAFPLVLLAFSIDGTRTSALVEATIRRIVLRHEALRARFVEVGKRWVQEIHAEIPTLQIAHHKVQTVEEGLAEVANTALAPWDLGTECMLRCAIVEYAGTSDVSIVLAMHHVAMDWFSALIIEHEVIAIYDALVAGEEPSLPPVLTSYSQWAAELLGRPDPKRCEQISRALETALARGPKHLEPVPIVRIRELPGAKVQNPARAISALRRATLSVLPLVGVVQLYNGRVSKKYDLSTTVGPLILPFFFSSESATSDTEFEFDPRDAAAQHLFLAEHSPEELTIFDGHVGMLNIGESFPEEAGAAIRTWPTQRLEELEGYIGVEWSKRSGQAFAQGLYLHVRPNEWRLLLFTRDASLTDEKLDRVIDHLSRDLSGG